MDRKVILYIAMSLDGYIAKHDGNIDFLSAVETTETDYGYADFLAGIDTMIWGRKTFDKVLSMVEEIPHRDKKVFVVSRTRTGSHDHVIYHPDVVELVKQLKQEEGKNIYCDGGSEIIAELMKHSLIDKMIISIVPHLLGGGIPLFREGIPERILKFKQSVTYPSSLVQLWYELDKKDTEETSKEVE
ncbi:MAG TPA: dihydrofolate reductase family protein [Mariniphaga sp.]|nr:dihydrofolate reductase family protein [Mariniphaga sp.]